MVEITNSLPVPLCQCGRAPHRKGQRNCHFCNRDANRKYRQSLKRMEARLKFLNAKGGDNISTVMARGCGSSS